MKNARTVLRTWIETHCIHCRKRREICDCGGGGLMFNVWMQLPQFVNNKRPWSLIAQNVTEEQAGTYRETLLFPVHVELVEAREES